MNEPSLPGALDDFLQHPPQLPPDAARQDLLFQQTTALLRKPARRRWPMAVALAACIALALIAAYGHFFHADSIEPAPLKENVTERKPAPPPPEPAPESQKPNPPLVQASTNPRDLEWSAFDTDDDLERVRLYFQAGDLYLQKHNDRLSAVRCYAQALSYCEARDLEFNPDDNWLVMALKSDFRKEK